MAANREIDNTVNSKPTYICLYVYLQKYVILENIQMFKLNQYTMFNTDIYI